MIHRRKRAIVIISLCAVLMLMTIGYAAFNTMLNIEGTTSISSNWNVLITNVEEINKTGIAESVGEPKWTELTASMEANLYQKGDSVEYNVTVENKGTLDAYLAAVNESKLDENEAIKITVSGYTQGEKLSKGDNKTIQVKIEYNPDFSGTADEGSTEVNVELQYEQVGSGGVVPKPQGLITSSDLIEDVTTEGDGLYADEYESGRYVYKGAKPNNYITFNGETWRIISVETDGTIKIMRQGYKESKVFDSKSNRTNGYCSKGYAPTSGCNAWATTTNFHDALNQSAYTGAVDDDSEIKKYLNGTYYESITKNKTAIQNHVFYYGGAKYADTDLANQIKTEKEFGIASNVGLIQASDYIKANSNTSLCGTFNKVTSNYEACKPTNYMVNWMSSGDYYWTITPYSNTGRADSTSNVLHVHYFGIIDTYYATNSYGLVPSLYLKSDIELAGQGTEEAPYTIENYTS